MGTVAAATWFVHRRKLGAQTWGYLDSVAYSFPFGWIFGRLGCTIAFDHPGRPTSFFLGETFTDGVVRHNLGLEEAIYTVAIAALFAVLSREPRRGGYYVGLLAVVYAPVRFALDALRVADTRYFGLTPAQYGAVVLAVAGLAVLWHSATRALPPVVPPNLPAPV